MEVTVEDLCSEGDSFRHCRERKREELGELLQVGKEIGRAHV